MVKPILCMLFGTPGCSIRFKLFSAGKSPHGFFGSYNNDRDDSIKGLNLKTLSCFYESCDLVDLLEDNFERNTRILFQGYSTIVKDLNGAKNQA